MIDRDRPLVQPWFDVSGLDETSPEWASAWGALVAADMANDTSLLLWPTDTDEILAESTRKAACIRVAVTAGASYAAHCSTPMWPGAVQPDAGMGVGIALALLDKVPGLADRVLAVTEEHQSGVLVEAAMEHVIGVFFDAPSALVALLAALRHEAAAVPGESLALWPPLVTLILEQATCDEVFAEHVILSASKTPAVDLDYALLPTRHWLLLRNTPNQAAAH